jgi:Domain of unknown function (DUF4367)
MKKLYFLIITLLCIGLTACGTQSLSQKEVLEKASEAVETLKGYSIEMDYNIQAEELDMKINGKGDVTHNPDAMHMNMSVKIPGMTMDFEMYVKEKDVYMSMFGEWLQLDPDEMGIENFDQLNKEEMDKLVKFHDDFNMKEKDGKYVLSLSAKGEGYEELIQSIVESSLEDFSGEMEGEINEIKVNNLEMEIVVDKKSFMMLEQTVKAELEVDGEKMTIDGKAKISNINNVKAIEIPQEVIDSALEMEDSFEMEGSMTIEEIQELVDYTIPQITELPEGYSYLDSYYDESYEVVTIDYEKDWDNGISLSIYPSKEAYGEVVEDETTTSVKVNGNDAFLSITDDMYILTWEQDGLFLEIFGYGPSLSKEIIMNVAESVK